MTQIDPRTPSAGLLDDATRERLLADAQQVVARYPEKRSALLPLLHLVQSEQGYVSPEGIEFCAEVLDLTTAEVSAVATFYTMYKRRPVGDHLVGVCTNTLCAIMGGDAIFQRLKDHLGVGNDERTEDGSLTLEHIECQAACDYAPVMTVDWEFFDGMTPDSAVALVDALRAGEEVQSTRGPRICSFRDNERLLAGFPDGRVNEGPSAGPATLAGVHIAEQQGWRRPGQDGQDGQGGQDGEGSRATSRDSAPAAAGGAGVTSGYGNEGGPSGHDAPMETSASDPDNTQSVESAAATDGSTPNAAGEEQQ
ncbi:MAG: NADH-quinone oxidoreductase subunit NuoE [Actinomycetales bacterium]